MSLERPEITVGILQAVLTFGFSQLFMPLLLRSLVFAAKVSTGIFNKLCWFAQTPSLQKDLLTLNTSNNIDRFLFFGRLSRRVGRGGAMGANAPPHWLKRSAWKDPKMNLQK